MATDLRYNKQAVITLTIGTYSFEMTGPADEVEIAVQKFYDLVINAAGGGKEG